MASLVSMQHKRFEFSRVSSIQLIDHSIEPTPEEIQKAQIVPKDSIKETRTQAENPWHRKGR